MAFSYFNNVLFEISKKKITILKAILRNFPQTKEKCIYPFNVQGDAIQFYFVSNYFDEQYNKFKNYMKMYKDYVEIRFVAKIDSNDSSYNMHVIQFVKNISDEDIDKLYTMFRLSGDIK